MMLIVLDSNPVNAANKVPDKLKFKQLLELAQMICSCGYCDIYKKVPQGKAIQEWIKRNPTWTKEYIIHLFQWCKENKKLTNKTCNDISQIIMSMPVLFWVLPIKTAVFRYSKEYKNTSYATDTELPIYEAITEYEKYLEWKQNANLQSN